MILPVGKSWSLDEQCRLEFGEKSSHCRIASLIEDDMEILHIFKHLHLFTYLTPLIYVNISVLRNYKSNSISKHFDKSKCKTGVEPIICWICKSDMFMSILASPLCTSELNIFLLPLVSAPRPLCPAMVW